MGRPANPINYDVLTRGRLAELLRQEKAGRTYDELAVQTGVSAATLKRAASGNVVPSEKVIDAFLAACGSGPRTVRSAKALRHQARRDELGGYTRGVAAATVNTGAMLADALDVLYKNAGAPTYREMQTRAGGAYLLPLSSISRILRRQMLPVDEKQMLAFLKGCHVPQREHGEWIKAWRRAVGRSSISANQWVALSMLDAIRDTVLKVGENWTSEWAAEMASVVTAAARLPNQVAAPELAAGMASVVEAAEKHLDTSRVDAILSSPVAASAETSRRQLFWKASVLPRTAAPSGTTEAAA
ncbi:helix-turn-helix domain-containing protein [Streptomyces sp. NPDC004266]|uniref:helix-turn-helix domain-containing protein n=1 Tax=Streptomyces sp. NPDC004266 TaxID=3364693 RepID=UPI0036CC0A29